MSGRVWVNDALRRWARGGLPAMAAVDFLIVTGSVRILADAGLIEWNDDGTMARPMWPADWTQRVGNASGGEIATLALAHELQLGVLAQMYPRMDVQRREAFLHSLGMMNH